MDAYKEIKIEEEIIDDEEFKEIYKMMWERSEIDVGKCKSKK